MAKEILLEEIRLNEFIEHLKQQRKNSGEENPIIRIGSGDKFNNSTFGNYELSIGQTLNEKVAETTEIFIITKVE